MIQQQHIHSNHLGVLMSFRCSAMRVATLFIPLLIASLMDAVVALSDDEDGPTGIEDPPGMLSQQHQRDRGLPERDCQVAFMTPGNSSPEFFRVHVNVQGCQGTSHDEVVLLVSNMWWKTC